MRLLLSVALSLIPMASQPSFSSALVRGMSLGMRLLLSVALSLIPMASQPSVCLLPAVLAQMLSPSKLWYRTIAIHVQ